MKTSKITRGFISLSDANFQNKSQGIYDAINGNANFPTPSPDLATLLAAITAFGNALSAAQSRDRNSVAIKNQKRQDLTDLLVTLMAYVTFIANGDKAILVSSGFDLAKEGESVPLPKPANIQVDDGINAGELIVSVDAVKGAKTYVHEYTPDPVVDNSSWTQVYTTVSKYTFRNLSSAKKYWCRVSAVGPYDQVVISDAISRVVQ